MVGEAPALVDRLAHGRRGDARRRDLVIDAPADVLRIRLAAVRPPGVMPRIRVQPAEHTDEAGLVEDMGEPGALLWGEAGILLVRAPVGEIDLAVRDVPVAAQNDLLLAIAQQLQVLGKVLGEAKLGSLPGRPGRSRWHVDRDDPQVAEARLDIAAFGVE